VNMVLCQGRMCVARPLLTTLLQVRVMIFRNLHAQLNVQSGTQEELGVVTGFSKSTLTPTEAAHKMESKCR
jgi:hypothetical protein